MYCICIALMFPGFIVSEKKSEISSSTFTNLESDSLCASYKCVFVSLRLSSF